MANEIPKLFKELIGAQKIADDQLAIWVNNIKNMSFKEHDKFRLKDGVTLRQNSNLEDLKGKTLILSFCVDADKQVYKFTIEGEGPELYAVYAGDLERV